MKFNEIVPVKNEKREVVRIDAEDFARIVGTNRRLYALVTELQKANTELLERARNAEAVLKGMGK